MSEIITGERRRFIELLEQIVGRRHVLTGAAATRRYRTGLRCGAGPALAVVRPGTLVEQWRVLQACVRANKIVIVQAANTGLTGGSTPDGEGYDRDIVIVNTLRIARVRLIDQGRQVICHAGATLFQLEKILRPLGREPHSVIGSSCIGASVVGGVCNSSGGSLIRRGPAYTEMALYAQVDSNGEIRLVNHLGVRLGDDPESMLRRLDGDAFTEADVDYSTGRSASCRDYVGELRDIDASSPARFNADARRLFETSGSAGKVMVFAVRLDTFSSEPATTVFYIGTDDPEELTTLRRYMLEHCRELPIEAEYLHRTAFDIAVRYGKDTFLAIRWLGAARLPKLFAFKGWIDSLAARLRILPPDFSDKLLQAAACVLPNHLPARLRQYRDRYRHHLMLKVAADRVDETREILATVFQSAQDSCFECTEAEGKAAFLHRFVTAGAAIRYRALHRKQIADIIALDIALRRNELQWFEQLPESIAGQISHALYYGHFFCHVLHQDYLVHAGTDVHRLKQWMLQQLDERGAEYPAEHNVGHSYPAKPALVRHYRELDPANCFNPGVGHTSRHAHWE
ncbi:D-lactate dehydrogenase [Peristeroidobacter soli]|uniref:D-lactate dehydrogenase n=1 Tax=Peristeroidobacter soli TaxID=2497877 RepID=UPI001FE5BCDF|nr:D-lactate dehydrogenase [Peristeroidobacter soli]